MARGLLGGMVLGGVVGVAGLALLSQSLPMPDRPAADPVAPPEAVPAAPEAAEPAAPAEPAMMPEPAAPAKELAPAAPEPSPAEEPAPAAPAEPAAGAAPPAVEAAPDAAPSEPVADAAPAAPTEESAAPAAEAAARPEASSQSAEATPAEEPAPAAPAEPATGAAPPAVEAAPDAAPSEPVADAAPATPTEEFAAPATEAAASPEATSQSADATPAAPEAVAPPEGPAPRLTTAAPDLPAGDTAAADLGILPPADLPPPGLATAIADLPAGASSSEAVPEMAEAPPPPPLTPEEEALLQPAPAPAPEPAPALIVPDAPPPAVQAGLPPDSADLPAVAGVETGRLPQIGGDASTPAAMPEAQPDARPLVLFARPFTREEGKPLFSILLADPGGPEVDRTTLAALPFPVTFVLDPMAPDAATAAAIYRAAGQEVVMAATGIPAGATAADLEQTFQAHANALPESIAVIDLPEGGMGEDRPLATLAVPVIQGQGRGIITYDVGLNAGDQVARRADMPAATVFRRLDAEDETKPVIRRYLDRAAFKAAQDGQVMVIGTTRPETVAAILEWTVEGRATTVSLAPASAVLLAQ